MDRAAWRRAADVLWDWADGLVAQRHFCMQQDGKVTADDGVVRLLARGGQQRAVDGMVRPWGPALEQVSKQGAGDESARSKQKSGRCGSQERKRRGKVDKRRW